MSSSRRRCKYDPDAFCYMCSEYMMKEQKRNINYFVKRAYKAYFDMKLGHQNKPWHHICQVMMIAVVTSKSLQMVPSFSNKVNAMTLFKISVCPKNSLIVASYSSLSLVACTISTGVYLLPLCERKIFKLALKVSIKSEGQVTFY